jgi:hypothetical protein
VAGQWVKHLGKFSLGFIYVEVYLVIVFRIFFLVFDYFPFPSISILFFI